MRVRSRSSWERLAEPFHPGRGEVDGPPWRENAFLAFFDPDARAAGAVHLSTSPNAPGRARASVVLGGRLAEIVEPLGASTFTSDSIDFDLTGNVRVDGPGLALELSTAPRFVAADYTALELIPPLPGHDPLVHYQQGADVDGWVDLGDGRTPIRARGFRDRTWGMRDESKMFVEYLAGGACFDTFDLTVTKFLDPDGGTRAGGYRLSEAGAERVVDATLTRSASGLLAALDVGLAGGDRISMRTGPGVGFWAPMGVERTGPALAAYEECVPLDAGPHGTGAAVFEHGVLRRLY